MRKIILLGGGIDSTTLLVDEVLQGNELYGLFFNYNQRAYRDELRSVKYFCKKYNVDLKVVKVELDKVSSSEILKNSSNNSSYCLEGRNAIFLTIAVTYAAYKNIGEILVGFHKAPMGYSYADSHEPFLNAFNNYVDWSLNDNYKNKIKVVAPYKDLSRVDIFKKSLVLDKEIIDKSYTCYYEKSTDLDLCACNHCLQKREILYILDKIKNE